jgi:hypothetical protein
MREASFAVRPVLQYYSEANLKGLITICLGLLLVVLSCSHAYNFILNGIWFVLTLVAVVGYFRVPALKQLEEYLWR